ncbi:MAG: right-handed parallel beta-helix repeat-containing protein [Candidatus Hodarchaeales archaeon]
MGLNSAYKLILAIVISSIIVVNVNWKEPSSSDMDLSRMSNFSLMEILPGIISTNEEYENQNITINSNLNITSNGKLTFNNCSVNVINDASSDDIFISVQSGGCLIFNNSSFSVNLDSEESTCRLDFAKHSNISINSTSFVFHALYVIGGNLLIQSETNNLSINSSEFYDCSLKIMGANSTVYNSDFDYTDIMIQGKMDNDYSSRARIINNTFHTYGIVLTNSNMNIIKNNHLNETNIRINLSNNNSIINNLISMVSRDDDSGIELSTSEFNQILLNTIKFNDGNGIELRYFSNSNIIQNNSIYSNIGYAISIIDSDMVEIKDNILFYNGKGPIQVENGMNIVFENNVDNFGNEIEYKPANDLFGEIVALGLVTAIIILIISSIFLMKKIK